MRTPERIDEFLGEVGRIWKEHCPDWRFSQLFCNIQRYNMSDCFYLEENEFLQLMKEYFDEV